MLFDIFTREGLINFLYMLPALLISITIHELAHAYTAYKLGDTSQKAMGRLTLDPLAHIDWTGLAAIALIGFGWGKPVMVDEYRFKNRSRDTMLVSLAGPMSNLVLAFLITIVAKILLLLNVFSLNALGPTGEILVNIVYLTILFNVVFAVFNMLPIPPFDGSKVLFYFLPNRFKGIMYFLESYSFIIIIILIITGVGGLIISPIVGGLMNLIISILK